MPPRGTSQLAQIFLIAMHISSISTYVFFHFHHRYTIYRPYRQTRVMTL